MKRNLCAIFVVTLMCASCGARQRSQSIDKQVSVLITRMTKTSTEQKAFADLEALGCAAVPEIISRMDDRRKLPDRRIALKNESPDAFEAQRLYRPEEVVDALAAILNQVTGQSFGFIYSGASDDERTKAVQKWREFKRTTPSNKLCSSG